jgi:hypothetical protein
MKKSPERTHTDTKRPGFASEDERFEADLAAEDRILSDTDLRGHPELEADRALRRALGRLELPDLPTEIRRTVIDHRHDDPERRWTWIAMAAAVILSVIVVTALDPFRGREATPRISEQDWAQLTLAIETLNAQGQQIAQVTQRQVGPHLVLPDIELPRLQMQLEPLPTPESFQRWFQPGVAQPR